MYSDIYEGVEFRGDLLAAAFGFWYTFRMMCEMERFNNDNSNVVQMATIFGIREYPIFQHADDG